MKTNVDLTENQDFRSKKFNLSIRNLIRNTMYPWSMYYCENDSQNEIVLTGDKKRRLLKKQDKEWGIACNCCGRDLTKNPWIENYGLCAECNDSMDAEIKYDGELVLSRFVRVKKL
jgi:hypothetical protein